MSISIFRGKISISNNYLGTSLWANSLTILHLLRQVSLRSTKMNIIFWEFLILYQIFFSPQVKRSVIISNRHGIYELSQENLKISQNYNPIKTFPQSTTAHENQVRMRYTDTHRPPSATAAAPSSRSTIPMLLTQQPLHITYTGLASWKNVITYKP